VAAAPPRERLRISPRSALLAVALAAAATALLRLVAAAQRPIGWILVAATLAGLLHPVVARLDRVIPHGVAVLLVLGVIAGIAIGVGYGVVDEIQRETEQLQEEAPRQARRLERSPRFGEAAREFRLAERTQRVVDDIPERLRGGSTAEALQAAATRGVAFLATGVLTVFMLLHGPHLASAALDQVPGEQRRRHVRAVATRAYERAFGYARGRLALAFMAGLFAYGLALWAEVPGDAPLALWVGLWDLVPVVGMAVGALPIVVLAGISSATEAVVLGGLVVVYQLTEALVVQPRLEARTMRLGPFLTLAAALVGLEYSGVAGALLFVLATAMAVAVASELAQRGGEEAPSR
jgi:predicted PurR-regulated permease PerM